MAGSRVANSVLLLVVELVGPRGYKKAAVKVASKVVRWVDTKVDERAAVRVDLWECVRAAPRVDLKGVSKVAYWVVERVGQWVD